MATDQCIGIPDYDIPQRYKESALVGWTRFSVGATFWYAYCWPPVSTTVGQLNAICHGEDDRLLRRALLLASAIEAFFLLVLLGYGPLYLHQELHAGYFLASQAAALPALATFAGSMFWGQMARRSGLRALAVVGLLGYLALGAVIFVERTPLGYIVGVSAITLCSSALAPATLTLLTESGGNMGRRLAQRLQWQSSGWMMGGLLGGYIFDLSSHGYLDLMVGLSLGLAVPLFLVLKAPASASMPTVVDPIDRIVLPRTRYGLLIVLLVLPFFLAYSGNEGFFTNFGLYLSAIHISGAWVGWSAAISTGLGWILASRIGRWADQWGGKMLLTRVLLVYVIMYVMMSLVPWPVIVVGAFCLPLYPLLNIGVQRAVAESVPSQMHGAAMGMINGASGLATFVGGLLIGGVDETIGPHMMPWAAATLVGLGLAAALTVYRRRTGIVPS